MTGIKRSIVNVLGMELERWEYESCVADFGVGDTWATLYMIQTIDQGKGHASELLISAKKYYEDLGKKFGGSVALNKRISKLYKKLEIEEV